MPVPQFELEKTTIGGLVDINADQFGDSKAVLYPQLGIEFNFREFRSLMNDVAKGFMALGIEKGEHIAIWANNVPEWLYTQFGSPKMGAVLVTVNTNYRAFELEYLMKQSDSTTLIMIGGVKDKTEYVDVVNQVCPELKQAEPGKLNCAKLPKLKNVIFIGEEKHPGMLSWKEVMAREAALRMRSSHNGKLPANRMMSSICNTPRGRPVFPKGSC
jgi:fatty-acyl-CoA synthase